MCYLLRNQQYPVNTTYNSRQQKLCIGRETVYEIYHWWLLQRCYQNWKLWNLIFLLWELISNPRKLDLRTNNAEEIEVAAAFTSAVENLEKDNNLKLNKLSKFCIGLLFSLRTRGLITMLT